MIALAMSALLAVLTPMSGLDLPPEGIMEAATVTVTAERGTQVQMTETSPPPETAPPGPPAGLSDCDEMNWYRANAGLPAAFARIGWRESNCRNEDGVRTFCCYGYWQLNVGVHLRDHRIGPKYRACGVDSYTDVNSDTPDDKRRQACAAKALYDVVGMSAWSATR
jgi:hypothetical protein